MKKAFKIILGIIIAIVLIVAIYFAYVFISYYRIEDNKELEITSGAVADKVPTGTQLRVVSANVGFGAYSDDYSFFMDGGTESWAFSKEDTIANIKGSVDSIAKQHPDFILMQEIDTDSTRSYHVDEQSLSLEQYQADGITGLSHSFAQNYDSPFLFYPITQPHGKSVAGLLTLSKYEIQSAIRRSLPIETGFSKLIDLDRCYSKNYIDLDNGKQLCLINCHLSAYTTDPSTAENQVIMLNKDMLDEVAKGNYVIVGGDMNKDLLGDSTKVFTGRAALEENWASPFPTELLDSEFSVVAPIDMANPVPSCRNADMPYDENVTFVLTIDGFIVSSNVEVVEADVVNNEFKYSDHNPVYMDFVLK